MPVEQSGDNVGGNPYQQTSAQTPVQSLRGQGIPSQSTNGGTQKDDDGITKLEKDIKSGEKWLIGIGIATIAVNIGIAWIYYGQLKEMREVTKLTAGAVKVAGDTLETTRKANSQQTLDNAASAAQSKVISDNSTAQSAKSLQATIDNFHQEQRAWVGILNISPATFRNVAGEAVYLAEGHSVEAELVTGNSGKTPALDFTPTTAFEIRPIEQPFEPTYDSQSLETSATIQPGFGAHLVGISDGGVKLNQPKIDNISAGTSRLYIYGIFTYKDVFRRPRKTTFCYFLTPDLKRFRPCKSYNDAT